MAYVLLIEDDQWLAELYSRILEKRGHHTDWQRDIYDALASIGQKVPDILILDIMLPWSNGLQLLHELASYSDLRHIPILVYSNALPAGLGLGQLGHYGVSAVLDKAAAGPHQLADRAEELLRG